MSIDNVMVFLSVNELRSAVLNGKVNSVRQIDRDSFLFQVHTDERNRNLLFNLNSLSARVCITENIYSFTDKPSNFLLLLKKHLTGKRISAIQQVNNDRIIRITFNGYNQFGDEICISLYSELIGNNANLILCDNSGIIIDCLKKREYCEVTQRAVLPGLLFRTPPEPSGLVLPVAGRNDICALFEASDSFQSFISKINGISAKIRANLTGYSEFLDFIDYVQCGRVKYYCYGTDDGPGTLSYVMLKGYSGADCRSFESIFEAFDFYYRRLDFKQRNSFITKKLNGNVTVLLNRKRKKLINLESDLSACSERDNLLKDAELLKANLYRVRKGDKYVRCTDFYSDDFCEKIIEIDPSLEPSVYLSNLYRKYSKLKTAETVLNEEIKKCRYEIEHLESILDEINRAVDENDAHEIEKELVTAGYLKINAARKSAVRSSMLKASAPSGKEILIGRNNAQNDELTFKKAFRDDMWFHVKNHHGSHVVLRSSDNGFSEMDIITAAEYAAFYSQARNGGKVAVDYTSVANVHRNSPYYPGRVLYTDYKTVIVSSDLDKKNKSG